MSHTDACVEALTPNETVFGGACEEVMKFKLCHEGGALIW